MLLPIFQLAIFFHSIINCSKIENSPIESILILMPKSEYPAPFTNSNFSLLGFYKENSLDRSACYNV